MAFPQTQALDLTDFQFVRTIAFTLGDASAPAQQPAAGTEITDDSTAAKGIVVKLETTSGDWTASTAAGTIHYVSTNPSVDFTTGGCSITGRTGTFNAATIGANDLTDGVLDSRLPNAQYLAIITYTPGGAGPVYLSSIHGCLVLKNDAASDLYGFAGAMGQTADRLCIPINFHHGPSNIADEGTWFAFGVWDDSATKLLIYVFYQGTAGDTDGTDHIWRKAVMSPRIGGSAESGTKKDLAFSDLASTTSIVITYDTNDSSGGSSSKSPPSDTNQGYDML